MKRSARRLGVEGAGMNVIERKKVENGSRDRRFADAALVRANDDDRRAQRRRLAAAAGASASRGRLSGSRFGRALPWWF